MPNLYLIGTIVLLIIGFGVYVKYAETEKAALAANMAKLEVSMQTQKETIESLQKLYETIAKAQKELVNKLNEAEKQAAQDRALIDDFKTDGLSTDEIERKINEEFNRIQFGIVPSSPSKLPDTKVRSKH